MCLPLVGKKKELLDLIYIHFIDQYTSSLIKGENFDDHVDHLCPSTDIAFFTSSLFPLPTLFLYFPLSVAFSSSLTSYYE